MDLPFLNLDTFDQMSTLPESTNISVSSDNKPDDVFKTLVSELIKEGVMPGDGLEIHDKPGFKAEKTESTEQLQTTQGQTSDFDMATLVAQLNMAQTLNQNQPVPPEMQKSDNQATVSALSSDVLTQQFKKINSTSQLSAAQMKTAATNNALPVNAELVNAMKKSTDLMDDADEEIDADDLARLANSSDFKLENHPADSAQTMQTTATQSVQPNQLDVKSAADAAAVSASTAAPELKPETKSVSASSDTTISTIKDPVIKPEDNKGYNAFVQLSNFINAHTQTIKDPVPQGGNFKEVLANVQSPDNKLEIEMMPRSSVASLDSLTNEIYNAKIKIYPPELGHVTAELKIDKGTAQLHIVTETHQVKDIVEANIPQLKERFQNADITLTNVNVQTSQHGAREQSQQNQAGNQQQQPEFPNELEGTGAVTANSGEKKTIDSLIDTYA